jgi:hypothetical protein
MRIGLAGATELYAHTVPLAYVRKPFFPQSVTLVTLFSVYPCRRKLDGIRIHSNRNRRLIRQGLDQRNLL